MHSLWSWNEFKGRGTAGRDTISGTHDPDSILREEFIQNVIRVPKSKLFFKNCMFKITPVNMYM